MSGICTPVGVFVRTPDICTEEIIPNSRRCLVYCLDGRGGGVSFQCQKNLHGTVHCASLIQDFTPRTKKSGLPEPGRAKHAVAEFQDRHFILFDVTAISPQPNPPHYVPSRNVWSCCPRKMADFVVTCS